MQSMPMLVLVTTTTKRGKSFAHRHRQSAHHTLGHQRGRQCGQSTRARRSENTKTSRCVELILSSTYAKLQYLLYSRN